MVKLLSLIAIVSFVIFLCPVNAINLGSVAKNDHASINYNESARFKLLFWNTENSTYKVELEIKDMPKDWTVIIQPKEFFLNSSTGEEYINLPYMEKSVIAYPVNVFVKPNNNENGTYYVTIIARAGLNNNNTISTFQERQFKFYIDVINGVKSENSVQDEILTLNKSDPEKIIEVQENNNYIIYLIVVICIFLVSLTIYKYA